MLFAYQMGPQLREFSLPKVRKAMEKLFAGDDPQDGVAQKFELLVVSHSLRGGGLRRLQFTRLRTVGKCLLQQFWTNEGIVQRRLQRCDVPWRHKCWWPAETRDQPCVPAVCDQPCVTNR